MSASFVSKSAKTLPPCKQRQKLQGRVGITGNIWTAMLMAAANHDEERQQMEYFCFSDMERRIEPKYDMERFLCLSRFRSTRYLPKFLPFPVLLLS